MTSIIGIHLILLGVGAFLLVSKAMFWGGVFDPWAGENGAVRVVTNPTLNPITIFGYLWGQHGWEGMAAVDNLEDVIGGHLWISLILVGGGVFHILTKPFGWAQRVLFYSGEAYLCYSLGAIAYMGILAGYFVSVNDTVYPEVFFGVASSWETAAGAALVSACGLIVILTICLSLYGTVSFEKRLETLPRPNFSRTVPNVPTGIKTAEGWSLFSGGFLVGGVGGAIFAYLLLDQFVGLVF